MPYAEVDDLMLGDMALGPAVSPEKYIQEAQEDVNISLGQVYEMPVSMGQDTPDRTKILLRRITARLASGRLILAQAIGGEDSQLQAYGRHLVDEAEAVLSAILDGRIDLEGPNRVEGAAETTGPTIDNYDKTSGVDAFYEHFMGTSPVWHPGG